MAGRAAVDRLIPDVKSICTYRGQKVDCAREWTGDLPVLYQRLVSTAIIVRLILSVTCSVSSTKDVLKIAVRLLPQKFFLVIFDSFTE